ncbi:MAG: hypothetical protein D6788_10530 [Planctomycetota bacterium]|nr:MAG: hypothetical protein D6788_10530 [Planctomycetota bacterium]
MDRSRGGVVVCAPGRLDVLGGAADFAGATTVSVPLDTHVAVALQPTGDDDAVTIRSSRSCHWDGIAPVRVPLSELREMVAQEADAADEEADRRPLWVRGCLGALVEGVRHGVFPPPESGLCLTTGSTFPAELDCGQWAALVSAVLAAVLAIQRKKADVRSLAEICRNVERRWLRRRGCLTDALTALSGRPRAVSVLDGETRMWEPGPVLDNGVMLIGIDCGFVREDAELRYRRARTAAQMGAELVRRIIEHEAGDGFRWEGPLCTISPTEYVERFRDRLPTRLQGRDFLDRFDPPDDPFAHVEPDVIYRVRSRTEHPIYEHRRALEFVEMLRRGLDGDEEGLRNAGELMYVSHWSCGQRCGLGCPEVDRLVKLLRTQGAGRGIYGARISGCGCGGVVTVLLRDGQSAWSAVRQVIEAYTADTGRQARILRTERPGALTGGVQPIN